MEVVQRLGRMSTNHPKYDETFEEVCERRAEENTVEASTTASKILYIADYCKS